MVFQVMEDQQRKLPSVMPMVYSSIQMVFFIYPIYPTTEYDKLVLPVLLIHIWELEALTFSEKIYLYPQLIYIAHSELLLIRLMVICMFRVLVTIELLY